MGRLPEVESMFVSLYDAWMDDEQAYIDWVDFYIRNSNQPSSVCELACGTGNITKYIAPKVHRYVASDINPLMIAKAKEKIDASVEFVIADMRDFDFNETFDCVLCAADSMNFNENMDQLNQT